MKKWDGLVGRMLSMAFVISLMLSLFAVKEAGAATDLYLVRPQANTHNNGYNYVTQTWVATADTITKISVFLGSVSGSSNYQMEIDSAGTTKGGVLTFTPSGTTPYTDKEGTYGTPVAVKRGYTYTLKFSRLNGMETVDFYYVADTTTYPWGKITYPGTVTGDLCARVVGTGRVLDVWGMCTYQVSTKYMAGDMNSDSMLNACKAEGSSFIREYFPWRLIQPDSTTYDWSKTDSMMIRAKAKGLKVLVNLADGANWCASQPQVDTCIKSDMYPYNHPPRGLYRPVFISSDSVNPKNYFAYYVRRLVDRYGHNNPNNFGPVEYWEIWNEENSLGAWDYPDTTDTTKGYPGIRDSVGLAALYDTLVHVAYQVIKHYDPQAKIVMGGLERVRVTGNQRDSCYHRDVSGHPYSGIWWLDKFLQDGSGQWIDVYAFHPYQEASWPPARVQVGELQKDADTLRKVLTFRGQGDKPLWANEVGYAASTACGINQNTQANNCVKFHAATIGLGANPYGPVDRLMWYELVNYWKYGQGHDTTRDNWWAFCGTMNREDLTPNPVHYSLKQMNVKLSNKYYNRQVPLADTSIFDYEYQMPGADTLLKTWCLWRNSPATKYETLSVRTDSTYLVTRDIGGAGDSTFFGVITDGSGKVPIPAAKMDTVPRYLHEYGHVKRPDVVVDDLYTIPANPKPGDGVFFYARLKNIGNASLSGTVPDTVTFQVDGSTIIRYGASRGLGLPGSGTDTLTVCHSAPYFDWTANWGDHLIRAWADSADRYVELREDNNIGYIFKHVPPTGTINIPGTGYPNGRKFSKVRPINLSLLSNGGISPTASQMKIKNSWGSWGSWQSYATSLWDTLPTTDGLYKVQAEFKMANGETSAIAIDSVILDMTYPVAAITSPANKATVSGTVPFYGIANDSGYPPRYFRVDTLRFFRNANPGQNDTIHVSWTSIGSKDKQVVTGLLGNWNTTSVLNGWTDETLAVWDSAGNRSVAWESLYVFNKYQGGAGFASDFGIYPSLTMNVATDPTGNVYVAETQNSKVRKYSPHKDSLLAFSAKRGQDSTGLSWATAIVLKDSLTIWIADGYAHCIKRFDRQGNLLLRFGSFGSDTSKFRQPCGIALDGKGRLWVTDRLNHRVQVFDSTGHFLFKFGSQGTDSGKFNSPTGITITRKDTLLGITQDLIWVSDTRNNRIQVFDSLGNWVKTITQPDSLGLDTPLGICSDKWGDVFISDSRHNRIVELNPYGERILDFGGQGDSLWQFRTPVGVASSPGAHYLYVADMGNRRVTRFWVIQEDTSGGGGPQSAGLAERIPIVYSLAQSHPNPTTGEALIEYGVPKESPVRLIIYNATGQVVRDYNPGKQKAGYYSIKWDGRSNRDHRVGAGVYFYRLETGSWVKTRKMVVVR